jgi:hypothetical protein
MKNLWLLIAIFLGGLMACLFLPAEWRGKLSRPLVTVIGRMVASMPDE